MNNHHILSFFKTIKKNKLFYSINLLGFVAGFILLTIISTFVYQELSFDRFHKNASGIYRIHSAGYGVTPLCFKEKLANSIPEIDKVIRFSPAQLEIRYAGESIRIDQAYYADQELFQVFSFPLVSGETVSALEVPYSLVLDRSTARRLFGNAFPLGEIVTDQDGAEYTITGIMKDIPYNSHLQAGAFIAIETLKYTEGEPAFNCGSWSNLTYVNLADRSDVRGAESKINTLLRNVRMGPDEDKIPLELQSLKEVYFDYEGNKYDHSKHGNPQTTGIYLSISVLILGIVIFNYINLTTAISVNRFKEFAIRRIIGAQKRQIILQLVSEAVGIALLSLLIALILMESLLPYLSKLMNIPVAAALNRASLYVTYGMAANVLAVPISYIAMHKWLQNFLYRVDINWLLFLKTLVITAVFNAVVVLLLIIRVQGNKLVETLKHA